MPYEDGNGHEKQHEAPWLKRYHWKPGQSGNPNGKKKGVKTRPNIDKELQDYFYNVTKKKQVDGVRKQMSYAEIIVRRLAQMVEKGNWSAMKYAIERLGGLPKVFHEITGLDEGPFKVEIEIKHTQADDNQDPSESSV